MDDSDASARTKGYTGRMELLKAVKRAVMDFGMLADGSRVLLGASGGKDSLVLGYALSELTKGRGARFSVQAAHVSGGLAPVLSHGELDRLASMYESMGITFSVLRAPTEAGIPSCYRCASIRRAVLMRHAAKRGYDRIALGHHLDDILTSALMNMVLRGQRGAMTPMRDYPSFGVRLIRPLAYVPEESVLRLIKVLGLSPAACSCPHAYSGDRAIFRARLETLTGGKLEAKRKLLAALGLYGKEIPIVMGDNFP